MRLTGRSSERSRLAASLIKREPALGEVRALCLTLVEGVIPIWHHDQMDALASRGIRVLIPPDAGKRRGARPGWDGGLYAFMRRVLATDLGGALYRKRQWMIEPVFADTKSNRRVDRSYAAAAPQPGRSGGCSAPATTSGHENGW
jgi:hypothetical protein